MEGKSPLNLFLINLRKRGGIDNPICLASVDEIFYCRMKVRRRR